MKIKTNKETLVIFLKIILLSSLFLSISFTQFIGTSFRYIIALIIFLLGFYEINIKKKKIHLNLSIKLLWSLVVLSILISCLYNSYNYTVVLEYVLIYILYFLYYQSIIDDFNILLVSLMLSGSIVCVTSLITTDINSYVLYPGIYSNSNTLALHVFTAFIAAIFLFYINKNRWKKNILFLVSFLLFYIVYRTGSRLCIFICVFSILSVIIHYISQMNLLIKKRFIFIVFISFILGIIIFLNYQQLLDIIYNTVFKYEGTQNDFTSNRFLMQKSVLNELSLLGSNNGVIHSHNDFLLLGQLYGIISALFYLANFSYFIILTISNFKKNKSIESYFYLNIVFICFVSSFFEELTGLFPYPVFIVLFLSVGKSSLRIAK